MITRTIRTTFQPEIDLVVDETEFLSLRHQGLIVPGWDADEPPVSAATPLRTLPRTNQNQEG